MHGESPPQSTTYVEGSVTVVGSQLYPGVPPGTVVRQQPAGGFKVTASDAVSLEVSR